MSTLDNRPNTALLVVDVQNGVVGEAHERDQVVANVRTLVDKARAAGIDVVWVQHNSADLVAGNDAWQYVPELSRRDDEPLVQKRYPDSFEETDLESVLAATRAAIRRPPDDHREQRARCRTWLGYESAPPLLAKCRDPLSMSAVHPCAATSSDIGKRVPLVALLQVGARPCCNTCVGVHRPLRVVDEWISRVPASGPMRVKSELEGITLRWGSHPAKRRATFDCETRDIPLFGLWTARIPRRRVGDI